MPTGYTAAIEKGIDFKTFAWSCARGMGALVMMRGEPADAPIPERFEPSDHYAKIIGEAQTELARLEAMTLEEAAIRAKDEYEGAVGCGSGQDLCREVLSGLPALRPVRASS